ncbi:MAG: AP2 domain-containing protein [Acidobacteria bacterium]|jgi:hypothetical protein|nr:AP2 domain-containing protein [Acidobacteriota bacterium]
MPKGITRIENYKRRADGWLVRLQCRGKSFSGFFKDADFVSKEDALREAQKYYRRLRRENPKISRQEHAERKTAKTGEIIGVRRLVKPRHGHHYEVWEARWSPQKNQRRVKTFGIEKYGEEEARQLAIEARLQGLAEMCER